jgi:hypothetical protein
MWQSPRLSGILDAAGAQTAQIHGYVFGSTTKKVYVFRGTWPPLRLLGKISQMLVPCFKHRAVKTCTKRVGRQLVWITPPPSSYMKTYTKIYAKWSESRPRGGLPAQKFYPGAQPTRLCLVNSLPWCGRQCYMTVPLW